MTYAGRVPPTDVLTAIDNAALEAAADLALAGHAAVDMSPGDATRYVIAISPLRWNGSEYAVALVNWEPGVAMTWDGRTIFSETVAAALRVTQYTGGVIARLLNRIVQVRTMDVDVAAAHDSEA